MGSLRKPDGLILAGIYEVSGGRTWICTHMEWGSEGLTKAGFYEPGTNKYNEASCNELKKMFDSGSIEIKTIERGRIL